MKTDFDVIVIGAGPAGSVAAGKMNKEGYSVKVLEKQLFPRFVIGESLLPKCMEYLDELELLPYVEANNFQVKSGAIFLHHDLSCEFLFKDKYTPGWDYTYQVKRADFDNSLVEGIKAKGVDVEFEATVTAVKNSPTIQEVTYEDKDGISQTITARFIIDASGYGRVLPRLFNLDKPVSSKPRGAVFAHVTDTKKSEKATNNIFVHIFRDNTAWIWAIPFSDNTTSVGIVGDSEYIEELAAHDGEQFKKNILEFPFMKERFGESEFLFEPRKIINYASSVTQFHGDGFVLCGNATEFLDPVFSSGVTLAVVSGYRSAELVAQHLKEEQVDWENNYVDFMNNGIDVFRTYVNAWYSGDLHTIFFAKEIIPKYKEQICSVLAGYVWDETNPFVTKHAALINKLATVIRIQGQEADF